MEISDQRSEDRHGKRGRRSDPVQNEWLGTSGYEAWRSAYKSQQQGTGGGMPVVPRRRTRPAAERTTSWMRTSPKLKTTTRNRHKIKSSRHLHSCNRDVTAGGTNSGSRGQVCMAKRDYYEVLGRRPKCGRQRTKIRFSETREATPSRRQSRTASRRTEIQGNQRSV